MEQPERGSIGDLVCYRIETAKSDLLSANILLKEGEYRGTNNRAYYAVYHAISAVHALDGKSYKRHKNTLAWRISSARAIRLYIILVKIANVFL